MPIAQERRWGEERGISLEEASESFSSLWVIWEKTVYVAVAQQEWLHEIYPYTLKV